MIEYKYIYPSSVLKYNLRCWYLTCHLIFPLHYILETNILLFTPLHLSDNYSFYLPYRLHEASEPKQHILKLIYLNDLTDSDSQING